MKNRPELLYLQHCKSQCNNFEVNQYVLSQIRKKLQPSFKRPHINFKLLDLNVIRKSSENLRAHTENIRDVRQSQCIQRKCQDGISNKSFINKLKTQNQDDTKENIRENFYHKLQNQNEELSTKMEDIRNRMRKFIQEKKAKPIRYIKSEPAEHIFGQQTSSSIFQLTNIGACVVTDEKRRKSMFPWFLKRENSRKVSRKMALYNNDRLQKAKQDRDILLERSKEILRRISNLKVRLNEKIKRKCSTKGQEICTTSHIDEIDMQFQDGLAEEIYATPRIKFRKKINDNKSKQLIIC